MAVPGAEQREPPGQLPPSPAVTQGLVRPATPRASESEKSQTRQDEYFARNVIIQKKYLNSGWRGVLIKFKLSFKPF